MNAGTGLWFLRPHLCRDVSVVKRSAYIRFYNSTKCLARLAALPRGKGFNESCGSLGSRGYKSSLKLSLKAVRESALPHDHQVAERIKALEGAEALKYPRIESSSDAVSIKEYHSRYKNIKDSEKQTIHTVRGRVENFRAMGKHLVFIDIAQDGSYLQIGCNWSDISGMTAGTEEDFTDFVRLLRRGDSISITGYPYKTKYKELALRAINVPTRLTPCLAPQPLRVRDPETLIRNRHLYLLTNRKGADTLRARSEIVQQVRKFLLDRKFLEVQTPIIAGTAEGAIARPFTTVATEFSEKGLTLRIAPEIWLKRLILGGMDRIFEIGPAFRNEGLDATHNPEFTTCEFYQAYTSIEELIEMTEQMISGLVNHVNALRVSPLESLPVLDASLNITPFKRLPFIQTIEESLGETLPDLNADNAREKIAEHFAKHDISLPQSPTLPRLLDKLASIYIEPKCTEPTFIMYHPACMAPLAKSFTDPQSNQEVSARAELFIQNKEIANMYEEENSPFEQRRKFQQQAQHKDEENQAFVDENYLSALEWGLPPTGGWGCGIDRLCMLLTGSSRISEVLTFGSLKNVVGLGRYERLPDLKKEGKAQRSEAADE